MNADWCSTLQCDCQWVCGGRWWIIPVVQGVKRPGRHKTDIDLLTSLKKSSNTNVILQYENAEEDLGVVDSLALFSALEQSIMEMEVEMTATLVAGPRMQK